ncbi:hypothetical protein W59_27521 [Rhodococcus opacus RKJ300 = JCM 13270]|uniref:Uncharacterized protein n=1 Tax=Rhodococcus opacus RKJ300 = JCM 13270 TaxID=1165867 RepID=I0WHE9_RHOOP|nr:hypothetical protein W59_27521 [Rhodococcus opacus RKJ300 = JCM 13270]QQZ12629.1 hypothetical protein GO592_22905 [Rhodococcus sp. 21391]
MVVFSSHPISQGETGTAGDDGHQQGADRATPGGVPRAGISRTVSKLAVLKVVYPPQNPTPTIS